MNLDLWFIIIFYGLIVLFYFKNKKKFVIQNGIFAIYKTKIGLKLMDSISNRFPRILNILGYISISTGFLGMFLILYFLIKGTWGLIFIPNSVPVLAPVLPGVEISGLPVLSFWYWIISILFVAVVHEFSHGIFARFHKINIKSSGFAFFGPILAAFVEPDEKQLVKKNRKSQLIVFSAGPFSNIFFAGVTFLIIILISPLSNGLYQHEGVQVYNLENGFPASNSGLTKGELIYSINNKDINDSEDFVNSLNNLKEGDIVNIKTNKSEYNIEAVKNPKNADKGYLGVMISSYKTNLNKDLVDKYGEIPLNILIWVSKLFFWLFAINLGVGLFNLLPLGPVDGGRMLYTTLGYFIKKEKLVKKIYFMITFFCLSLIIINLLPWLWKLLLYLYNGILLLLTIL